MATNASQSVFVKKSMNLTTLVMENTRNSSLFGGHSNGNNNSNNYNNVYANGSSDYETKNDRSTAANLLIERLHGKSIQMRSWQDLSKTTKQNVLEKKIAPDDKFQMQKCLDIIQKNIEIKSVQSMKERLETICRQLNVTHNLNLKFNFTKSFECFISSDMFYIEIGLDQKTGQVLDCKVAHDNEETKSCPELVTVLQNRNFAEFTCHLEGLSSIFQIGAEKKTKTKIYSALQSLETDLLKMYEFQLSRINITSNLIHRSPAGIVEPRKGGTPMKLTFFVSPYQLIDLKTKTKLPLTVETITTKRIGFSATISIEESAVQQKLQSESLFYTTVSDNGQPMPHFHQNKNANSNMLPARFILKLSKPLPISLEIARKINCLTGIELTDSGGCEPRSLISLIAQQTLGRKANSPFYTKLPDQQHCYHVNETEMVKGILVEKIPFTHPTNVPRILNDLRLQIMFNVILGSLVRQVHGPVKNCKIFEISTSNLLSIFIQFENPKEQSLATLEIDLRDFTPTGVKCQLYPNFLTNCSDTFHTKILQKSLSIPITLRAILNKATGNVRSLSTGNKKDLGASAASSTLAEDVHGNNEEPNKTNGHSNKLEDGGKTNNVHQSKDARQANNAMTAGGDTYLRNMLSDVPHASPKKRKRPPGMEPIESSNKKRNLNQTTDQHEETLGTGAGQKANEFGANTVDKLNDKSLFAVKAGGGGDINKQVMRKLSAGSLGRSILTMSSVSAGGGGGGGGGANSLKSPESMESFIGGDQMSRKDRKRKRTELEAKVYNIDSDLTITPLTSSSIPSASLSDMAVTNSSMKGNNLANIAASADLMITSSNAAAAAASVAKSKKSAVLPLPTGTKTNAAQLLKLNAMLKQKNAVSHQQQQQMKMMVNPEMTAAMAVAAGGPPFDPTFIQAFAQAAAVAAANVANAVRLQNKQQVKQQQQQSKSLANLIGATSSSSSPSAKHQTQTTSGNKTKEQQSKASGVTSSSATGNLSLKQKNLPTSPNFAVATKITSPSLGGSSQQSLFQIAQSTSTSSSVPTSSSSSASTSTTGAGGAKNALKPAKKASINSVLERLSALRQNAGGDISEGIVSSAVALAAASAETMTVTSSSSSKNGDGNTNLFSKASGQNASSSTSTGSGGSKQTGGDNQQKQKYTIKGGTGLKTIITKNKSMAPSSTLTTSSSSSTADLLSKMSSGAALKTKYTIPKIPKASSSVTSSSSSSSTPSTAAAISSTNNSITSPPLSTSSSGSSSGGSSPSIKKSLTNNNNNSHKLVSSSSPSLVPGQSKPINMKTGSSSGGTSSFPIKATTPNSKQTKTITSPDSHANKSSTKTVVDRSSATTKTTTTTTATTNQWNAAVPTTTLATTPAAAVPTNDVSISSSTTTLDSAIDVAPKVTTSAVLPQIEALPLLTAADDKKAPVVDVVVSSSSNSSSANSGADDGPRSLGKFELASIAAPATGGDSNNNGNGEESSDKASKSTAAVTTVEPSPSLPDTSDTLTTTTSLKYD